VVVGPNWLANQVMVPEAEPVAAGAAGVLLAEEEEQAVASARTAAAHADAAADLRLENLINRFLAISTARRP
jgi:hypothetical protein